jgi:phosphotransacetylase
MALLALLPVVKVAMPRLSTMTDDEKESLDEAVTKQIKAAHKAIQKGYRTACQMTGDMDTDEAIVAMKKAVPSIP